MKLWYEAYKAGWLKVFIKNFPLITNPKKGVFVFWRTGHALHLSNPYCLTAKQLNKGKDIYAAFKTYKTAVRRTKG